MKRLFFVFANLAIFAVFAWNTGIIQIGKESLYSRKPEVQLTVHEQALLFKNISNFWNHALEKAEAKVKTGESYSPYDYFADLTEFHLKFYGMNGGNIEAVRCLMYSNVGSGKKYSEDDIVRARDKFYLATGQTSSISTNQEKFSWMEFFSTIVHWLLGMYVHNFFFAFLYFALLDMKRRGKFVVRNPLSLLLNTILHPITISIIFYQKMSEKFLEAEVRMTKEKFLTMLSKDEISFLQNAIQKKLSHKEFRAFLHNRGLVARRSFALALLGTCIITILPMRMMAQEQIIFSHSDKQECVKVWDTHAPPILLQNMDCSTHVLTIIDAVAEALFELKAEIKTSFIKLKESVFHLQDVLRHIHHIPLFGMYTPVLINNFCIHISIGEKNESRTLKKRRLLLLSRSSSIWHALRIFD